MLTPIVHEIRKPLPVKVNRPVPTISQSNIDWQDQVYSTDPLGGAPSRY